MQEKLIEELRELIKHPKSPLPEYGTTDELARHYIGGQKSVYDMFFDKITAILSRAEQEAKEEPLAMVTDRKGFEVETGKTKTLGGREKWAINLWQGRICQPFYGDTYASAESKARAYLSALPDVKEAK